MSRLLCQLSYSALTVARAGRAPPGAPIGNRTLDLLLTMETLCRLSYWGVATREARGRREPTLHGACPVPPNRWAPAVSGASALPSVASRIWGRGSDPGRDPSEGGWEPG